jgi:hypothetical protein
MDYSFCDWQLAASNVVSRAKDPGCVVANPFIHASLAINTGKKLNGSFLILEFTQRMLELSPKEGTRKAFNPG